LQNAHLVGAFVSLGIGTTRQAHAAERLRQRVRTRVPLASVPYRRAFAVNKRDRVAAAPRPSVPRRAPAITALIASVALWTPPVQASEARSLPCKRASQRSCTSRSAELERFTRIASRFSMSMPRSRDSTPDTAKKHVYMSVLIRPPTPASFATFKASMTWERSRFLRICSCPATRRTWLPGCRLAGRRERRRLPRPPIASR